MPPDRLVGSFYISPIDDLRLEAVQKYEPSYQLGATCAAPYGVVVSMYISIL